MATRLYFNSITAPSISPSFDANWEQTGQAVRRRLEFKQANPPFVALTDFGGITIPITTTQDILVAQFVSDPLSSCRIDNRNFSMIVGKCSENATTNNAHLAYSLRVLSNDGTVSRGRVRSSFATITEFPLTASAATRIISAGACTPVTVQNGDRLCLEVGIRANAPTAAGTGSMRFGIGQVADFALTSGLTTDLNSWAEFVQNLLIPTADKLNNYEGIRVTSGMSTGERIR